MKEIAVHLISSFLIIALASCGEEQRPRAVEVCSLPVCDQTCTCDQTFDCDPSCQACDPECGLCRSPAVECRRSPAGTGNTDASVAANDGGVPATSSCTEQIPRTQTVSEPCCPDFGRDACGALLFCAAL